MLFDRAGNDTYRGEDLSQGAAAQQAIGWLIELDGDDHYAGAGHAHQGGSGPNGYHFEQTGCTSFSLLLDAGAGSRDVYSARGRANDTTISTAGHEPAAPSGESRLHGLFIDTTERLEPP
jgi:hypothetical protein